jgi:hypothetical protein
MKAEPESKHKMFCMSNTLTKWEICNIIHHKVKGKVFPVLNYAMKAYGAVGV